MSRRLGIVACLILLTAVDPQSQTDSDIDPAIAAILARISVERLTATLKALERFETRHTLSETTSTTRGIGAARQWILEQLRENPKLHVSFDTYHVPKQGQRITRDVELRNVMAVLPGRTARRLYVTAHYDTVARIVPAGSPPSVDGVPTGEFDWTRGDNLAPGVNDDGSGTALTMELARVFAASGLEFDATLVFMLVAGEEQGLIGSKLHAQRLTAEHVTVDAVLNNDIIGNPTSGNGLVDAETVRVFSESPEDSPSRQLARYVARQAARYVPSHRVSLVMRHDRFGRGSDHTSFNQHGFAAVRITESNENYRRQHSVEDTFDGVSPVYLARNARVNAAALAGLALAPPAPDVAGDRGPTIGRGDSGYDAELRWQPSPGAAGYRLYWRSAWALDWQHEMKVGSVSQFTLADVSIDDHVFGVAAIGPRGHESLVTVYVSPPRRPVEILTTPQ
jgi:hypothetical protein